LDAEEPEEDDFEPLEDGGDPRTIGDDLGSARSSSERSKHLPPCSANKGKGCKLGCKACCGQRQRSVLAVINRHVNTW
jgi:hypothetical protein